MTLEYPFPSNISLDDSVDKEIEIYLNPKTRNSFLLFAGAGSGKTRSLVDALKHIPSNYRRELALHGHRVGVITYTNAACDEIKGRLHFHPLFYIATIHSFAWELINGFNRDIREWLRKKLNDEIGKLEVTEDKGRTGTKASISRNAKIESKKKRLQRLNSIQSFVYSTSSENKEPNSLNHAEVITICAEFLTKRPLMQWILVGRFPVLLIDECQDTNHKLIDALLIVEKIHKERFSLGLFGDLMQRIYQEGKANLEAELPDYWGKPSKKLNHRSPKRIVRLINKIREPVDEHSQVARTDAIEGHIKLFIRPANSKDRTATEKAIRSHMAEYSSDIHWNDRDLYKTLTLEHHMSAKRLGFENVYEPLNKIDNWRTGLLDGSLPPLRFFMQSLLPLVQYQRKDDRFMVSRLVQNSSPLLTPSKLKEATNPIRLLKKAKAGVETLMALWKEGEPTCGDVLVCVDEHQLFDVPESLVSPLAVLKKPVISSQADEQADPLSPKLEALLSFLQAPFSEIEIYQDYIKNQSPFDTHQGVKGLEFKRVMVIMDDTEARGFMFKYGKLLGDKDSSSIDRKNSKAGKETSIDRTRRLLYVTCSRAELSLALVVYAENPAEVKTHMEQSEWFTTDEIDMVLS